MSITRERLLAQIATARRDVAKLRKLYPACFDAQGRPIVAVAAFPRLPKEPPCK